MTKEVYPALFHFIQKAISDVEFPATKKEILSLAGERPVHVDWEQTVPLSTFVAPIRQEYFSCAAEFYCQMIAAM